MRNSGIKHPHSFVLTVLLFTILKISVVLAAPPSNPTGASDFSIPWILILKSDARHKGPEIKALDDAIGKVAAPKPFDWQYHYESAKFGTLFFTVNTTEGNKNALVKAHSDIIDGSADYQRMREELYSAYSGGDYVVDDNINQRQERLIIATGPKDVSSPPDKWVYHSSEGKGVTVYFVDTGININHPEFQDPKEDGRIEVIFSGPGAPETNLHRDIDHSLRFSHGSSVAGLVIGKVTGIARNAHAVMVTCLDRDGKSSEVLYLDALARLYDHIQANNKAGNVVINLSMSAGYLLKPDEARQKIIDALGEVWDEFKKLKNVVIVAASGVTEWGEQASHSWPMREAKKTDNMVVVGGVDPDGKGIYQDADFVKVHAPAWRIKIASNIGYQLSGGTSFGTALTSAILANYLSDGSAPDAESALKRLLDIAHPRAVKDGHIDADAPKVIWSGYSKRDTPVCKRANGEDCVKKPSPTPTKKPAPTPTEEEEEPFPTEDEFESEDPELDPEDPGFDPEDPGLDEPVEGATRSPPSDVVWVTATNTKLVKLLSPEYTTYDAETYFSTIWLEPNGTTTAKEAESSDPKSSDKTSLVASDKPSTGAKKARANGNERSTIERTPAPATPTLTSDSNAKTTTAVKSAVISKDEPPPPPPPEEKPDIINCFDVKKQTTKYVDRNFGERFVQSFCTDLMAAVGAPEGLKSGTFSQETPARGSHTDSETDVEVDGQDPNQLRLSASWPPELLKYTSTRDDCIYALRDRILDQCDSSDNPMNFKAGGEGEHKGVKYTVQPLKVRLPKKDFPKFKCRYMDAEIHVEGEMTYTVWGYGWGAGDEANIIIAAAFDGCGGQDRWTNNGFTRKPSQLNFSQDEMFEFEYWFGIQEDSTGCAGNALAKIPGVGSNQACERLRADEAPLKPFW
ncbi:hypothetical protein H072_4875 [Dactylellina haptotyla CBS 200.50]|uniref:Peptidase S8/S53 domain-containing protein n=1 Tax=Dactylellina haptotyla (strain CBS 200.50) TaxID=1284197 RepID=S8AJM6_DACHA|nr:hypothetical protein H072_4875 [Dactylellina haptotyla CBS 200.50]